MAKLGPRALVLACRSQTKGQDAVNMIQNELGVSCVEFMQLDLNDLNSVKDFANKVTAKYPKIDILLNNAGAFIHPDREVTAQ